MFWTYRYQVQQPKPRILRVMNFLPSVRLSVIATPAGVCAPSVACKCLKELASRTGVEPVSPP